MRGWWSPTTAALLDKDDAGKGLGETRTYALLPQPETGKTMLNREHGITVVMVTHEPDMAAYAGRIIRFVDGRIAADEQKKAA